MDSRGAGDALSLRCTELAEVSKGAGSGGKELESHHLYHAFREMVKLWTTQGKR
jgi:hypothetical protein